VIRVTVKGDLGFKDSRGFVIKKNVKKMREVGEG
jgi:hypothetical protein